MIVRPAIDSVNHKDQIDQPWDVIVIGAGPAGGVAALGAARAGQRTLLVDRKHFPRPKVCGACVNRRAMAGLIAVGLEDTVRELKGIPLREFRVQSSATSAAIPLNVDGVAIERSQLDTAIVEQVVSAGGSFLPGATATVRAELAQDRRRVALRWNDDVVEASASLVIVADGLSQSCLRELPEFTSRVANQTRVGVGGLVESDSKSRYQPGTIYMAVGRSGYVGMVQLSDGRLNVAAAFDALALKQKPNKAELIAETLSAAKFQVPGGVYSTEWSGTAGLTRRANRVASERIVVIGDAGGYVEPFTGEGIAWAVTTGAASAQLAATCSGSWSPKIERRWTNQYGKLVRRHQFWCRALVRMLRYPMMVNASLRLVNTFPQIVRPVLKHLNAPVDFGQTFHDLSPGLTEENRHGV